ncbi:putative F-box protein PP2-B8 [Olea europaea var. sylvestris]|uniref:putative F-box protein PP2-B8 n=1 Tax=Olea europaea var. sylvestris TaxID=158386 RepID=UPI000C1D4601|nr:putative F-box protein PP2-B8 [Olea europaea var. sylvestris]
MSRNYDNWERLLEAVLRREHDRELVLAHSPDPSFSSSIISHPCTSIHDNQNIQLGTSSNTVNEKDWERLLLPDYEDIISRSADPVVYATKKDLYLSLRDSPILHDGGKMVTSQIFINFYILVLFVNLTKIKFIYLFSFELPLKLHINNIMCRFLTVAELKQILRFDSRGQIDTNMLSPKTRYAAYLVYGFAKSYNCNPLSANAIISFNNNEDCNAPKQARTLHLKPWT